MDVVDKLLDIEQLAELTGLAVTTLRQWSSKGKLPIPAIRLSRKAVRYRRSDVEKWFKSREVDFGRFAKME